jgi:hypothetical protein
MELIQVIYVSAARNLFNPAELRELLRLLRESRTNGSMSRGCWFITKALSCRCSKDRLRR